ncbi:MAG: nitrous oxide reductase accessory protein NosL [Desulfuromonadales bacterium]
MKQRISLVFSIAVMLLSIISTTALAETDIDQHRDCKQCGMDRKAYGYSRMLLEFRDGRQIGTCSLHCVITELGNGKGAEGVTYKVADRDTRKLIGAEKAFWVIGGKKRGIMTMRAKWAFATNQTAQKFVAAYGGTVSTWAEALAAAGEDAAPKLRK